MKVKFLQGVRAIAAIALHTAACGYPPTATLPPPALSPSGAAAATARWADATPESLEGGRKIFRAKCNHCHGYPDIPAIAEDRWPSILDRMAMKAELSADEKQRVLRFILASHADKNRAPPE